MAAAVGGNLSIESLQDKSTYDSKQSSAGIGLSLCVPPFCYGASSVSGSLSASKAKGDYESVVTQAALMLAATLSEMGQGGASFGQKAGTGNGSGLVPGRVQSRINIANNRTDTTLLRENGNPVSAGFNHVLDGHFDVPVSNSRSVFSITPDELKGILQSNKVVSSLVTAIEGGQFVRTVDLGRVIGTTALKEGGSATSVLRIFTDWAGNLITAFPVKGGG